MFDTVKTNAKAASNKALMRVINSSAAQQVASVESIVQRDSNTAHKVTLQNGTVVWANSAAQLANYFNKTAHTCVIFTAQEYAAHIAALMLSK